LLSCCVPFHGYSGRLIPDFLSLLAGEQVRRFPFPFAQAAGVFCPIRDIITKAFAQVGVFFYFGCLSSAGGFCAVSKANPFWGNQQGRIISVIRVGEF